MKTKKRPSARQQQTNDTAADNVQMDTSPSITVSDPLSPAPSVEAAIMSEGETTATVAPATAVATVSGMNFINVPPPTFSGRSTDDAFAFVKAFERYVDWKNITSADEKRKLFAVLLKDNAISWFDSISESDKNTYDTLRAAFEKRYLLTEAVKHRTARDLLSKKQADDESVDDYVASVRRHAQLISASDDMVKWVLTCGLKPHISAYVTQQRATTVDEILDAARLAELTAVAATSTMDNTIILDRLAQLQVEIRRLGREGINTVQPSRSPTPERRRVSFDTGNINRRPPAPDQGQFHRASSSDFNQGHVRAPPPANSWPPKGGNRYQSVCSRCGRQNCSGQRNVCHAFGKQCFSCRRFNHVSRVCRAAYPALINQPRFQL